MLLIKANGWECFLVNSDLSNLGEIMDWCYDPKNKSVSAMIEVVVDADQIVGENCRISNLRYKTFL